MKGFNICCISSAMDGTDDDMLQNGSKNNGYVGVSARKMMALTVKVKTVAVIGKVDRI